MNLFIFLHGSEYPYGKVDKASFSTETLMEMVVSGLTNSEKITGGTLDINFWEGVVFEDHSNVLLEIRWESLDLSGTLQLESLPESLQVFNASGNTLHGTINLTALPENLIELNVFSNKLNGTLDLRKLPASLVELSLSMNQFFGSVDLTKLPPNMTYLTLYENSLVGVLDLTELPRAMKGVYVHLNNFEGPVSIGNLPSTLVIINLAYNTNLVGVVHEKSCNGVDVILHDTSITYIEESK
mmetsp:Transcript_27639/g.42919  ORF Transcript_27639/g.42919 Transcript_27639/m.42919 type:complete len:241 (-) Transcript_27639:8-730(-)